MSSQLFNRLRVRVCRQIQRSKSEHVIFLRIERVRYLIEWGSKCPWRDRLRIKFWNWLRKRRGFNSLRRQGSIWHMCWIGMNRSFFTLEIIWMKQESCSLNILIRPLVHSSKSICKSLRRTKVRESFLSRMLIWLVMQIVILIRVQFLRRRAGWLRDMLKIRF